MLTLKRSLVIAGLCSVTFIRSAFAQAFSVDWFTIDSGGGAIAIGVYSLSGTIGQPDAGPVLATGAFSLTGGFWSVPPIQDVASPVLQPAFISGNTLRISWPSSATAFTLQQTLSLSAPTWTTPSESVSDDGVHKSIVVDTRTGSRFFRLVHP